MKKTKEGFAFEQSYLTINDYFEKYSTQESLQDISQLDGYLAAVVCSDILITPATWLVDIWGGEEHVPQWQNETELEEFNNCVLEYYNQLCYQFLENDYHPLIIEDEKGKTYPSFWALGFIDASEGWQTDIEKLSIPTLFSYGMIALLADENPKQKAKELNIDYHAIEPNLAEHVKNIYHKLNGATNNDTHAPSSFRVEKPFIREGKKLSRNEPCLCGSGKKYKKCCLNYSITP